MKTARSGFTLIELITAIATVGVLVNMVLPALQTVREETAAARCTNNLKQIGLALHNYEGTYRRLPATLPEVLEIAGFPKSGLIDGFSASMYKTDGGQWTIAMDPAAGYTGVRSALATGMNGQVTIRWIPIAGAEEKRAAMLAQVQADGAAAIGQLMAEVPVAEIDKVGPGTLILTNSNTYQLLKGMADAQGRLLLGSNGGIWRTSGDQYTFTFQGNFIGMQRSMQLGINGEKVDTIPGVDISSLSGNASSFFGIGTLRSLTEFTIADQAQKQYMVSLLDTAQAAMARGDKTTAQSALKNYRQAAANATSGNTALCTFQAQAGLIGMSYIIYPY
jgi:prepilin-type N-terminal cleavage/methylation domain-containing protein